MGTSEALGDIWLSDLDLLLTSEVTEEGTGFLSMPQILGITYFLSKLVFSLCLSHSWSKTEIFL
jgi:hypothetical protein